MLSLFLVFGSINPNQLSCRDYHWLSSGVEEVENISEAQKSEIKLELIRSTDPKCFDN